ncbi:MAG: DNRLRE domain-containing protein [Phycisphaerae bacterium]|nr:DNRLRE domain-containing protein [Phycisphaerae bacterium]
MTFNPDADNWISSCSSGCTGNNGDDTDVWIRAASLWGDVKNFRGLLQFGLSEFPFDGRHICHATLGLYFYDYHWDSPEGRDYTVHRVTSSWEEMESTWRARDDYSTGNPLYWDSYLAGVPSYQPGGGDFQPDESASAVVPAPENWMTWDVTELVREWVDEACANEGLLVKDANEFEEYPGTDIAWGPAHFRSSNYPDDAFWPYLEVTFSHTLLAGDLDCDDDVDLNDLPLFIEALLGDGDVPRADMDGDGDSNGLDIQPFVNSLLAGG